MKFLYILCFCLANFLFICGEDEVSEEISEQEIFEGGLDHIHPYGKPVSVLNFGAAGKFIIDNTTLDEIFQHPDVKDRKVVAVSIIGAFRKGKSFLMDYALRYMYGNYKSIAYPNNPLNDTQNWMGDLDEPLKGFSWKGGVKRDTSGIIMWSDVFLHEAKSNKLAIILMDTQGLFDTKTSPTENSRIFALGTLASSIQIFNLNDVILENQLEYLQLATEFSQFAMKKNKESRRRTRNFKPFQKLIFLMRDWQNKQEYDYGEVGGMSYLTNVLHVRENQPESLKNVRNFIKSSFEKLECFLMPHPGINVTSDPEFQGQKGALEEEFEQQLKRFLEYILAPGKLLAKKILNIEVSGSDYVQFLKAYFNAFESEDIPRVETLHSVTIRKQFQILIGECMDKFKSLLKPLNFNSSNFLDEINDNGSTSMSTVLQSFKKKRKLGGPSDELSFLNELKLMMDSHFTEWKANQIKTYENLKRIEEEKLRDLQEAEQKAKEKLEEEEKKAQQEIENLRRENEEMEKQMNDTINRMKTESENKIAEIRIQLDAQRKLSDQSNRENLNQLEQHNEEMRRNVFLSEQRFQEDYRRMKTTMELKEKEIERLVAEKVQSKLDELKALAEQKRVELEQQLKVEVMRAKAEAEDREWNQKIKLKELKIREEAEVEKARKYETLLVNIKEEQKKLQELFLTSARSSRMFFN